MGTIKSYTDIEQSKVLAEFLPLESADMRYGYTEYDGGYEEIPYPKDFLIKNPNYTAGEYDAELPCWSLSALFDILPNGTDIIKEEADTEMEKYMCTVGVKDDIISAFGSNPVDACYDMILKLNEQKLL